MTAFTSWVLLHAGHSGGISNTVIAMSLAGIGVLLVLVGLYRLYTYEEPAQGLEDEHTA